MTRLTLMHDTAYPLGALRDNCSLIRMMKFKGELTDIFLEERLRNIEHQIDRLKETLDTWYKEDVAAPKIIVEVLGGVAHCDDERVEIVDYDNLKEEENENR